MSFVSKFQSLPPQIQQEITAQYTDLFPFEVRYILANWLETRPWSDLIEGEPQHAKYTDCLVKSFLEELRKHATDHVADPELQYRLQEVTRKIEQWAINNPFRLVKEVQRIFLFENTIIEQYESSGLINMPMGNPMNQPLDYGLDDELKRLHSQVNEFYKEVDSISQDRSQLLLNIHEYKRLESLLFTQQNQPQQAHPQQPNQMTPENNLARLQNELRAMQVSFFNSATANRDQSQIWIQNIHKILDDLKQVQHQIVHGKLSMWKREQQLANNGCTSTSPDNSLERIQALCVSLSDLLCQVRKMLFKFQSDIDVLKTIFKGELNASAIEELTSNAMTVTDEQIATLVQASFVIEKQPPQVMKTNIRFVATVTLLTGNKFNVDANPPTVYAYIINEHEASQFLENPTRPPPNLDQTRKMGAKDSGANEILNNHSTLEQNPSTGQVVANFRNMQLKRIKRTEKKGTESVMDEKFAILFTSTLRILNGAREIFVWTMSLPVVVIVHGNQEPHAWATITWDNAFADPTRTSFRVNEKFYWPKLAEVLDMKFKYYVNLRLTHEDLHFLACKILREQVSYEELNHRTVTWSLFAKDNLPERTFTFWEWFFAILKVSREPLKSFFQDKSIIGFLTRKQTEEMLLPCPTGTFLLRFSDSELGGVTIAWVGETQEGSKEVFMVQPFTSRDFQIRGLADRIGDLKHLTYFYPNIPKDQVFGKFYSPDQAPKTNGYVKPVLALTLLGYVTNDNGNGDHHSNHLLPHRMNNSESPSTPMSNGMGYIPQSPESASVSSIVTEYMT